MKFAPLAILLLLFSIGCEPSKLAERKAKTKSQISAVNQLIDSHNPGNARLSRSMAANSAFSSGLDFMKGKRLEEFPEIVQLAEPLTIEHPLFKDYRVEEWVKQFPDGTTYKLVYSNIWGWEDVSEPTDSLVFVIQDGKVANWRMFSLYPY